MNRHIALLALLLATGAPVPAAAAPVIAFPKASDGDVAVDETGTAHFVWETQGNTVEEGDFLNYCHVAPTAKTCTTPVRLPQIPLTLGKPEILVDPETNNLVVVDARCCGRSQEGLYAIVSENGGATWSAHQLADGDDGLLQAELSSDGTIVNVVRGDDNPYSHQDNTFQSRSLDGPLSPGEVLLNRLDPANDDSNAYQTIALGYLRDGRTFVLGEEFGVKDVTPGRKTAIRILTGENPNDFGNWSPWSPTRPVHYADLHIASGSTGPWVMYQGPRVYKDIGARWERWEVARVSNTGKIGPPEILTGLYATYGGSNGGDIDQDAAGGLHAVWASNQEGCFRDGVCLVYRHRPPGGVFGMKNALVTVDSAARSIFFPRVSADSSGDGWTMWQDSAITPTTFRATRLENENEERFGEARIVLSGPRSCVKRKKGFTGTVTLRPVSGSGVTLKSVQFSFREYQDRKPIKHLDTKAPFTQAYALGKFDDSPSERGAKTRALEAGVAFRFQGVNKYTLLKLPIDVCNEGSPGT
jgi:hypothetical protein